MARLSLAALSTAVALFALSSAARGEYVSGAKQRIAKNEAIKKELQKKMDARSALIARDNQRIANVNSMEAKISAAEGLPHTSIPLAEKKCEALDNAAKEMRDLKVEGGAPLDGQAGRLMARIKSAKVTIAKDRQFNCKQLDLIVDELALQQAE